jgi:Zn finger protein HypA/HybF involved in hydrogenase expression
MVILLQSPRQSWMSRHGETIQGYNMKCYCHTCRPIDPRDPESVYMRLCPSCGNKRCPKATDHRLECSGSNDVGQVGSIYGVVDSLP